MKHLKHLAILAALALLSPLGAFAQEKSHHSVDISDTVKIGNTQLKPGDYKVEWQGMGPNVQVSFLQYGKTIATAPATLQTNDNQVTQDDIVTDTSSSPERLREIDFGHQKEALLFAQGG